MRRIIQVQKHLEEKGLKEEKDNNTMPRFDLLFSYWIFTWFLVYIAGWTTYNPTFALTIATLENSIMLALMYKTRIYTVLLFILALFLFKLLPLYVITRRIRRRDIVATLVLFSIYAGWMYFNGQTLAYTIQVSKDVIENKIDLPFTSLMKKILKIKPSE